MDLDLGLDFVTLPVNRDALRPTPRFTSEAWVDRALLVSTLLLLLTTSNGALPPASTTAVTPPTIADETTSPEADEAA